MGNLNCINPHKIIKTNENINFKDKSKTNSPSTAKKSPEINKVLTEISENLNKNSPYSSQDSSIIDMSSDKSDIINNKDNSYIEKDRDMINYIITEQTTPEGEYYHFSPANSLNKNKKRFLKTPLNKKSNFSIASKDSELNNTPKTFESKKREYSWENLNINNLFPLYKLKSNDSNEILVSGEFNQYSMVKEKNFQYMEAKSNYVIISPIDLRIFRNKENFLIGNLPLYNISISSIINNKLVKIMEEKYKNVKNLLTYSFCIEINEQYKFKKEKTEQIIECIYIN